MAANILFGLVFLLVVAQFPLVLSGFGLVGGLSEERKCEKDCQDIANAVQKDVEGELAKLHIDPASYEALSYCTQVVAGINYFIKVSLGDANIVHIRVFQDLEGEVHFVRLQTGKGPNDPITYF